MDKVHSVSFKVMVLRLKNIFIVKIINILLSGESFLTILCSSLKDDRA